MRKYETLCQSYSHSVFRVLYNFTYNSLRNNITVTTWPTYNPLAAYLLLLPSCRCVGWERNEQCCGRPSY